METSTSPAQDAQAGRLQAPLKFLREEDVCQLALPIASPVTSVMVAPGGRGVLEPKDEKLGFIPLKSRLDPSMNDCKWKFRAKNIELGRVQAMFDYARGTIVDTLELAGCWT